MNPKETKIKMNIEDRATIIGRTIYLEEIYLKLFREKSIPDWAISEIKFRLDEFHDDTTVKDVCKYGTHPNVTIGYDLEKEFITGFLSQLCD